MAEKRWTRARVLKAYAEWRALSEHAEDVYARYEKANGREGEWIDGLQLPGWLGTGWPGTEFELRAYDAGGCETEYPVRLPMEYLWTVKWEAEAMRKYLAWKTSLEAQSEERREKEEYRRLKAKYGDT